MFLAQRDTQLIRSKRGELRTERCRWVTLQGALPQLPLSPHSPTTQARAPPLELYRTQVVERGVVCVLGATVVRRAVVACSFIEGQMRGNRNEIVAASSEVEKGVRWV